MTQINIILVILILIVISIFLNHREVTRLNTTILDLHYKVKELEARDKVKDDLYKILRDRCIDLTDDVLRLRKDKIYLEKIIQLRKCASEASNAELIK